MLQNLQYCISCFRSFDVFSGFVSLNDVFLAVFTKLLFEGVSLGLVAGGLEDTSLDCISEERISVTTSASGNETSALDEAGLASGDDISLGD